MSAQRISVYGDPMLCHSDGCDNDAAVIFRIITEDDVESVVLCDACWRRHSNAFRQAELTVDAVAQFRSGEDDGDGDD